MNEQERHNLFAELITRHQGELYGYIYCGCQELGRYR